MTYTSKDKLNAVHLVGSLGIAGFFAALAQSWPLFIVIAASLIAAALVTGQIRPTRPRK